MNIGEIIRINQPGVYEKLQRFIHTRKEKSHEQLSNNDIKKMMEHGYYKRGPGGAIRQVR